MKKILLLIVPLMLAQVLTTSCNKEGYDNGGKSMLRITFDDLRATAVSSPVSKATGSNHGNSTLDAEVHTLQLYAFNADGSLDSYYEQTGNPIALQTSGTNVVINVTVSRGNKTVYAIANSHDMAGYKSVTTLNQLLAKTQNIKNENVKNFFMIGHDVVNVDSESASLNLNLVRVISRVKLSTVQSALTGGYQGLSITNVKAYLINVNANTTVGTGEGSGTKLNIQGLTAADTTGCSMPGMLGASLPNITATASSTSNYFYCYSNTDATAKTMLVIEGTLNSHTYYYPIVIADNPSSATYKLSRNTSYDISNLVITRPGSDLPYKEVEKGSISLTLTVTDWTTKTYSTITI